MIAGGELALAIFSAALSTPAADGSYQKNVELVLRLIGFKAFFS